MTKWKNNSYQFKKESLLYDTKDNENRLLLREFRSIPIDNGNKERLVTHEYITWGNSENLMRLKRSKNIFLDATFHHHPGFY